MNHNWPTKKLGEVIELTKQERVDDEQDTPIMSITMGLGLIDQSEKFKERVASRDISNYKKVKKNELVIGFPIDEGVLDFQKKYNYAAVSPAYSVWKIKDDDADMSFLEYFMRSDFARNIYRSRMVWTTERRRFIPKKQFLSIPVPFPEKQIQKQIAERMDKIAEARKLNDDLIQKSDELFQSLLHKELNPAGKDWKEDKFVNCIEKNPLKIKGIPREKYQTSGKFPIIDQSDKFIVGYTDDENKAYKIGSPVIIFGDHTRIFKYIDFDFAIGADGTQIVIPDRKIFIPEFFYFLMLNLRISNLGYSRHFKILKTKRLIIPPLEAQKQIVAKLSAAQEYKKQLLEQKLKLKELFDSVLHKSMTGGLIN